MRRRALSASQHALSFSCFHPEIATHASGPPERAAGAPLNEETRYIKHRQCAASSLFRVEAESPKRCRIAILHHAAMIHRLRRRSHKQAVKLQ
jgi:hypothetical protein